MKWTTTGFSEGLGRERRISAATIRKDTARKTHIAYLTSKITHVSSTVPSACWSSPVIISACRKIGHERRTAPNWTARQSFATFTHRRGMAVIRSIRIHIWDPCHRIFRLHQRQLQSCRCSPHGTPLSRKSSGHTCIRTTTPTSGLSHGQTACEMLASISVRYAL